MIWCCPLCGNLMIVKECSTGDLAVCCRTCPIVRPIKKPIIYHFPTQLKKPDNYIFEEEESWKNASSTDQNCPECNHPRAYFMQIQIRSADEPMTTFYRCCNHECKHTWKEN